MHLLSPDVETEIQMNNTKQHNEKLLWKTHSATLDPTLDRLRLTHTFAFHMETTIHLIWKKSVATTCGNREWQPTFVLLRVIILKTSLLFLFFISELEVPRT